MPVRTLVTTVARSLAAVLLAAGLLPLLTAGPAAALSCVGIDQVLQDADRVFTGRIVDAEDGVLRVEVAEVWHGGPVEAELGLPVLLEGWSAWADPGGEVPDGYSSPHPWLFAPDEDGAVGPCTAWRADAAPARGHRPDRTREPVADGSLDDAGEAPTGAAGPDDEETPWPVVAGLAGGGVAVAALGVLLVRRRGRGPAQG